MTWVYAGVVVVLVGFVVGLICVCCKSKKHSSKERNWDATSDEENKRHQVMFIDDKEDN
jgi:hypothetical protein